jgi:hypothetical protein
LAHNLVGMAQDVGRVVRGRQGDHRTELDCRWDEDGSSPWRQPEDVVEPSLFAWSLHLEARVSGHIDESRLRRALNQVFGSRPADHDVVRIIDCPGDSELGRARAELQAEPVPVSDWPPLRVWLAHHQGGDVVMLNANHAACDGPAALQVLRSIAQAYTGSIDSDPLPNFLASGDLPVHPAGQPVAQWLHRSQLAVEKLRDLLARHAHVAQDPDNGEASHGFHLMCLSASDTSRIIDAQRPGRSRNVLLAGLHMAVEDWTRHHENPGHRIAVLAQINLRPPDWRVEKIGNFSVTARVSTSRRHRTSPASALAAVTAQTTRNKRTRSGIALIAGLDRSGLLSLWAKQSVIVLQPLTRNRLIDTAILANLGTLENPPSFGPEAGTTVDIWYSAPSRAPQSLSIGAVTVDKRLHIVVRYPERVFDEDAARRFAEGYVTQLLRLAESLTPNSRKGTAQVSDRSSMS